VGSPTNRRDQAHRHGVLGRLYQLCLDGARPAEELPAYLRDRLITRLHGEGWTDVEIAVHTYMTLYTTVRIRNRLGLSPNAAERGAA
jgi:hypothetical protein